MENISQLIFVVSAGIAFWLSSETTKYKRIPGTIIGILCQILGIYLGLKTGLWGFALLGILYIYVYSKILLRDIKDHK